MVWAHIREDEQLVLCRAMAALGIASIRKLLSRSVGPIALDKGTVISLVTQIEGATIANPHSRIVWTGSVGCANVILSAPKDADPGTRRAACFIRLNSVEIARIDLLLLIGKNRTHRNEVSAETRRYRRAFASYASQDRDLVLAHVHGMRKVAPKLDVFVDVMSLRSATTGPETLSEARKHGCPLSVLVRACVALGVGAKGMALAHQEAWPRVHQSRAA
jgi:hypothetical protein